MACCKNFMKFLLFLFTFIVWLFGLFLIGMGIYALVSKGKDQSVNIGGHTMDVGIPCLIIGGVMEMIGFLGCCGTLRKSKCMLYMFALLIAVIAVGEIGVGIYGLVKKSDLVADTEKALLEAMDDYLQKQDITDEWNRIQKDNKCCGTTDSGTHGWDKAIKNDAVPVSCSKSGTGTAACVGVSTINNGNNLVGANCVPDDQADVYTESCMKAISEEANLMYILQACFMFFFAFIEFIGVATAIVVAKDPSKLDD